MRTFLLAIYFALNGLAIGIEIELSKVPVLEILKQSVGARKPSRNKVVAPARQATQPGGICSLESIFVLLKRLKIRALASK